MPRLTARRLGLYSTAPGAGAAATAISKVVTQARTVLRREKPKTVEEAAKIIGRLYYDTIRPVMVTHAHTGACDTEPRHAVAQALVREAKAVLGIDPLCYEPSLANAI